MGVHKNVGHDKFPEQGKWVGSITNNVGIPETICLDLVEEP